MVTSKQFSYCLVTINLSTYGKYKNIIQFYNFKVYKQRVEQYDYAVFRLLVGYFLAIRVL